MALYRCAACGSSHVVADTKKEGFSVSKAVVGTALFGAGGAVMGVNGKEQMYYHCADCGQVLSYAMSQTQKWTIDYAFEHKHMSRYVEELNNLKKQYSGIEWSESDSYNAQKLLNSQANSITDKIITECIEYITQKSCTSHDELVVFLTNMGYGQTIISEIKDALANKDDIPIRFVLRDNKLFYELCYDKTGDGIRPLGHYNRLVLRDSNGKKTLKEIMEDSKKLKEKYRLTELENEILSELSKYENPVTVTELMAKNKLIAKYSRSLATNTIKLLNEKGIVEKTAIQGRTYWSLVK